MLTDWIYQLDLAHSGTPLSLVSALPPISYCFPYTAKHSHMSIILIRAILEFFDDTLRFLESLGQFHSLFDRIFLSNLIHRCTLVMRFLDVDSLTPVP
jgi:hypothetical protein